jgi:hypothetical protein
MAERRLNSKEKFDFYERKRNARNSRNYRLRQKEKNHNVNTSIIFFWKIKYICKIQTLDSIFNILLFN